MDAPAVETGRWKAGEPLAGYVLERRLGRGGDAEVWLARRPPAGEPVAIKIATGEAGAQALRRAAEAHRALRHRGIVPHLEDRLDHDPPLSVLAYVPGGSLRQRLRAGPWGERGDPRPAYRLLVQICEILAYAHEQGIAHLDLKPENILLGPDDSPRITDFGCARRLEQRPGPLVLSGELVTEEAGSRGSPIYVAPERLRGEPGDFSADVYALGAIWFELLTGRWPEGASRPSDAVPGLLPHDDLPFVGCFTSRELRPRSAGELLERLHALVRLRADPRWRNASPEALWRWWRGEPVDAPGAATGRLPDSRRRQRTVAVGIGLLFAGLGMFAWWGTGERLPERGGTPPPVRGGDSPGSNGIGAAGGSVLPRIDFAGVVAQAQADLRERREVVREADALIGTGADWEAVRRGIERFTAGLAAPRLRYETRPDRPWTIEAVRIRDGQPETIHLVPLAEKRARREELARVRAELDRLALDRGLDWPQARERLAGWCEGLGAARRFAYDVPEHPPWTVRAIARGPDRTERTILPSGRALLARKRHDERK
ncbi:MAG: serine/threonine protein kinase [Planctomycetota bacterium]|nr:MAG: serine/threonine protein kinase [Planctomycetota bacterium]